MTGPALRAALGGAVLAQVVLRVLRAAPPGGAARWTRVNHAGDDVTLLEGPAYAVAAGSAALLAGGGPACVVAALGPAAFGGLDDLVGDSASKGLRGHVRALRHGRVTTGVGKIVGLAASGALAASLSDRAARQGGGQRHSLWSSLVGGAVIAGSANAANLFDLRPGRALKVTVLAGLPLVIRGSVAAAAAVGAAAGCLPPDLAARSMLGDTGSNSAGAVVGLAIVQRAGPRGRLAALAVLTLLTLASEKVSFTQVIAATPVLRELDALGRPSRS